MKTTTCELTFSDGAQVSGTVACSSPEIANAVDYNGAVERLPRRYEESDNAGLICLFKNLAVQTGGKFKVEEDGQFEEWAL